MTLRALNNKKIPALGLLRATVSKNIGSIILLSVAMLIFCPGFFITVLSKTTFKPENYTSPDALNTVYGVTAVLSSILVCVGNYVNFAYLYKKSSSDVFGALPLTRTGMLFARAAATFISVLIPVTIGYTALAFLNIPYPSYAIGTVSQIASAYLVNVLLMLAFSGFSLIFIICAGSGFDLMLSFGGFNIAVLAIGSVFHSLCDNNLSGYVNGVTGFLRILSPIYYLSEKAVLFAEGLYSIKGSADIIFGILKYAAVFFIASPLLYNFRKSERGEQAYAYKFIYVICGILAGICGGYALSQIFIFAADQREYSVIGFVSFIAGALITTVVYGAVTDRGFKGFKRSIAIGTASAAVYALVAVVIISGAFGFEKRIPKTQDVAAVRVDFKESNIPFTDPAAAISLHKAIIDKNADDNHDDTVTESHTYVTIDYILTKDKTMSRRYFVNTNTVKEELFKIYSSDERFAAIDKFIDETADGRIELLGDYYNSGTEQSAALFGNISRSEAKKIISVYKKELNALGDALFTEKEQTNTVADFYLEKSNSNAYESVKIYTTTDFPETNKLISGFIETDEEAKY